MQKTLLMILILLVSTIAVFAVPPAGAENEPHFWALLVSCDPGVGPDTYYMYRTLVDRYGLATNQIFYVSVEYKACYPPPFYVYFNATIDPDSENSTEAVSSAITGWLYEHSTSEDTVLIYFAGHGWGYDAHTNFTYCPPIVADPEEGNETLESHVLDLDGNPLDVNHDGDTDDWVGIDEAIVLEGPLGPNDPPNGDHPEFPYYDDDLQEDLSGLSYGTLVLVKFGCHSGGLIDDLSGPNRIVLTSTNETGSSPGDLDKDGFNEWTESFQDALYGEEMNWSGSDLVHTGIQVDSDFNNDSLVSIWEAWQYAWDHDDGRIQGKEVPWLDDDSNGLPTYLDETTYGGNCDNGTLAKETFLEDVDILETITRKLNGIQVSGSRIWLDGDFCGYSPLTLFVRPGNHMVQVESVFFVNPYAYWFRYWENNATNSWRNVLVIGSVTVTAYYEETDGGGCPYVGVWNGQGYTLDNNLLPSSEIHPGSDVDDYYRLEQSLVPYHVGRWLSEYVLNIVEFEKEHSYLDQAVLMAVDHAPGTIVAVTAKGEMLTYTQPFPPFSCVDDMGEDRLSQIRFIDGNLSDQTTFYQGLGGSYLIADFGRIAGQNAKLIIRADWVCVKDCIQVQVADNVGWQTIATLSPRDNWAFDAMNVSQYINTEQNFTIRLLWTSLHNLDYLALDMTPQQTINEYTAVLLLANHSAQGNVRSRLLTNDQLYVELTPGEQIQFMFILPNKPQGEQRTFILLINGYYQTI